MLRTNQTVLGSRRKGKIMKENIWYRLVWMSSVDCRKIGNITGIKTVKENKMGGIEVKPTSTRLRSESLVLGLRDKNKMINENTWCRQVWMRVKKTESSVERGPQPETSLRVSTGSGDETNWQISTQLVLTVRSDDALSFGPDSLKLRWCCLLLKSWLVGPRLPHLCLVWGSLGWTARENLPCSNCDYCLNLGYVHESDILGWGSCISQEWAVCQISFQVVGSFLPTWGDRGRISGGRGIEGRARYCLNIPFSAARSCTPKGKTLLPWRATVIASHLTPWCTLWGAE